MNGTVQRENGRVWIDGVPELGWGRHRECTFAGALEAALSVTDRPTAYRDIMGYTGLAFRVRWYQGRTGRRWCPSSPVGEFPDEIESIQKAIGWSFRVNVLMDEGSPEVSSFRDEIVASIDAGLPVPAYEPRLNMDVIYGYEDAGNRVLLKDYFQEDPLWMDVGELGPFLIFLSEKGVPPARDAAVADGLAIGARNWARPFMNWAKGGYHYGKKAFEAWERDLGFGLSVSGSARKRLFFVNWWNFSSLCDARRAAGEFLRSAVEAPGGEALGCAAEAYEEEIGLLGSAIENRDAFLGPWSGKGLTDWTEDVVTLEREILLDAMEIEDEAIGHIREAIQG